MKTLFLKFHNVTFRYDTVPEPLFQNITIHFSPGWSGVVGANGTGKTTLLKLATGLFEPADGEIDRPEQVVYCPQRTDTPPEKFAELLSATTKTAYVIKDQLGVQEDWSERWSTLSHGERKRAQIAAALWLEPDVLAIDEPTNHIDAEAREIIAKALHAFQGVGLLVSHDRELLDTLCYQCLFVEPPQVIMRPGGYTKGSHLAQEEQSALHKQQVLKKREYKRLQREAIRRRELADQYQRKRSKKGIPPRDHDAKAKIDCARMSGRDIVGGKLLRQLDGRLEQAQRGVEAITVKKQYTLGIWLPGSVSKRDVLLKLAADSLALGEQRHLTYPELVIMPTDRIALTGPNGTGKSTLIRHFLPALNIPQDHLTYVPQEIDIRQSQEILRQVRELPNAQLGHLMTIVSRLGSRPQRVLESTTPSPGETRKLLLALGMTRLPHLIIMDEPTNHMDLPSIECLEQALSECPGSLLLVSHDQRFLEKLTHTAWHIVKDSHAEDTFVVHVK